ncbi:hypothetical protein [Haloarchaeobius sp. HME9146]|uniref:hypothetical protein n=1 Tax=Haloarchaeobius sp. HME9146 TaxID=2978732 RepID=UPI0021C10BF8|nr:hypothetical protein [Haloarchaeobius sp. HME9146]MCT9096904.1 hypothetical protein [Haloarchaeobius sp. HME9146]
MALRFRSLLVVFILVLSGCSGFADVQPTREPLTVETTDSPTESTVTTGTASRTTDDGYYHGFQFTAESVDEASLAREHVQSRDIPGYETQLVDDLFADGNATTVTVVPAGSTVDDGPRDRTLDDGTYIRDNGTYYRIDRTVTAEAETDGYRLYTEGPLQNDRDEDQYETATEEAVDFANLSSYDQTLFVQVLPDERRRRHGTSIGEATWRAPRSNASEESQLVDGSVNYVRYDGDLYLARQEEALRVTVFDVRYDLVPVADSHEAFADDHLDHLVVPLNDSTPTEPATREFLVSVIEDGYVHVDVNREAVPNGLYAASLWIREQPPRGGAVYVRYQGDLYIIKVREAVE